MEADQFFSLQWNQHKGTIVSTFEKFFERNAFVDCTLAAEGQYLNVHKMILTACSPYFEVLLSQNHDKHPIIILKDVTFRELKAIVDYMYRGIANVSSTEMKDFLAAAASLQIKGLGKTNEELRNGVDEKMEFVGPQPLPSNVMEMSGTIVQGERSNLRSSPPVLDHPLPPNASLFDSEFGRDVRSAPQQNIQSSEKVQGVEFEETWMKTEPVNETCLNENYNLPTQPLVGGIHTIELVKNISNGPENTPLVGCLSTIPSVESSNILQMNVSPKHEPNVATQDVETASVSSVIELSDTSEECGELDMDDDTTPGGLWHSSQNTIAYESEASFSQQDGGSDVTQPSLASGDQDTENVQQGNSSSLSSSTSSSSSSDSLSTLRPTSTSTTEANTKSSEMCLPHEDRKASAPKTGGEMNDAQVFLSTPLLQKRQIYCRSSKEFQHPTGHMEIQMWTNSKEMPFRCLICDYSTFDLHLLKTHQRTHFGDRPFKCQECDTAFTPTCCLQRHQWRFAGERLFKCQNCEFISGDCRSLQEHRCTRAAERPFRCSGTREAIKVQGETNYKERGAAKVYYKCEFCDAAFRSSFKLVKHKRLHVGAYCTEER